MNPSRREFLAATFVAGSLTLAGVHTPPVGASAMPPVCVFSKHLQFIQDYGQLGRTAKDLGLDGLDLTVRKGGHVLPENVARDLPRAVEAIRAEGVEVPMITTDLNDGADPDARPILEAASGLGIPYARIGGLKYPDSGDILAELDGFTGQARALAEVLKANHMVGGYHNHSGGTNVGAVMWDLFRMIQAVNLDSFGSNFDAGHATIEGGLTGWRINARLLAPYVKMMAVKDFVWEGDKPQWVPLGKGIVKTVEILKIMQDAGFAGPVSLHFEYKVPGNDALLEEIETATRTLRANLKEAGYN